MDAVAAAKEVSHWVWLIELCVGLLAVYVMLKITVGAISRISRSVTAPSTSMLRKLKEILIAPTKAVFACMAVYYCFSVLSSYYRVSYLMQSARPFISAAIVICLGWGAMRWKKQLLEVIRLSPKVSHTGHIYTISKLLSIAIFIVTALVVLQVFELEIWPLLAFGGIGAAAVGFAAKDVIGSFCSGLMLSVTRPFVTGDQVLLPSLAVEGVIEEIGWYLTVIRDKDKRVVYLPNALFSSALVINSSRMTNRRIVEKITIRYEDFPIAAKLCSKIKEYLMQHPSVDSNYEPLVCLKTFADSGIELIVDVYVVVLALNDFMLVKEQILSSIYSITASEGARMAFPTIAIEKL